MMDLIDRKAAIEAMYDFMVCGSFAFLQCGGELEEELKSVPSVPAVPLEPLCEWLADAFEDPPCCAFDTIIECKMKCRGYVNMNYADCWRGAITKWMEGLDGNK